MVFKEYEEGGRIIKHYRRDAEQNKERDLVAGPTMTMIDDDDV